MFSSNFLSGGESSKCNMSSAVNKFSLFGDEEEKQQQQPPGPSKQKDPQQQAEWATSLTGASKARWTADTGWGKGEAKELGRAGSQPQGVGQGSPVQQGAGRGGSSKTGSRQGRIANKEQVGMDLLSRVLGRVYLQQQGLSDLDLIQEVQLAQSPPSAEHQVKGGPGAGVKSLCPVCKNTELNLKSKDLPNHNTCTQCKSVVCNMCGFSPPDATVSENS